MQLRRLVTVFLAMWLAWLLVPAPSRAQTVWDGPTTTFSKAAFADPSLPANQDAVLPGVVAITRGNTQGIYNAVAETSYTTNVSPSDTEWAFAYNNPSETLAAGNFAALSFDAWNVAHNNNPGSTVDEPAVMHIISADIYIDVMFTAWGQGGGSGGSFSYQRSTPPKVPGASPALLAIALAATGATSLGLRARRRKLR